MTPYEEQLVSIRTTAAVLAGIDESDHAAQVPNCPGWTVGDVIRHVAWQGPASWIAVIEGGNPAAAIAAAVDRQPSITEALEGLIAHLAAHDPAEPCRGFFFESDYAAWGVHCSVEIALHRTDVLAALGQPAELSASEARDGLWWSQALLEPMVEFAGEEVSAALTVVPTTGDPIHLGSGAGTATATGTAADLVFWLWGRGRGGVEVTGDTTVAAAWSSISGRSFQHEAIR